ncbi:MAG: hypothetical protein KA444_05360 [Bacteroidia bacterium]|nr:hypothetical protein [Bacteroidia bacterium]
MKNKRFTFSILLLLTFSLNSVCQMPDTDIFLAEITNINGTWKFGDAENVTQRAGYDNQPCFSPDDKSILYIQVADSTQSDIFEYTFQTKKHKQLTSSKESEYSPTFLPDKSKLSIVRVDQDSAQRFYTFSPDNVSLVNQVKGTDSIGYFCWLNDSMLAMFLVGERFSLQVLNTNTHRRTFIAWDIGRCLKLSADKKQMYFMDKSDSTKNVITTLQCSDFSRKPVVEAIKGSEDFSPLPDGSLIMGSEGKLFIWNGAVSGIWKEIKDYSSDIGPFYRIMVNEKASRIAFVGYAGKKP